MDAGIERISSSPVNAAEPVRRVRDERDQQGKERKFEAELEGAPDKKQPVATPHRTEPHPPADEDSGGELDVLA